MADYDSNMLKPVEGLQSITGLTPAKRNEKRKQRRQLQQENEEEGEQQLDESVEEQNMADAPEKQTENRGNRNPDDTRIDYYA
jgi:hypothetical protein